MRGRDGNRQFIVPCHLLFNSLSTRSLLAKAVHHVLNEMVIDRGAYSGVATLEVFVDNEYLTTGVWER